LHQGSSNKEHPMTRSITIMFALAACVGAAPDDSIGGGGTTDPGGGGGGGGGSGSGSDDSGGDDTGMPSAPVGRIKIKGPKLVDPNGNTVRITGINWFGFETSNYAPHGLWQRSMDSILDQIKTLGFNTIRVPFCNQMFDAGATPNGIDTSLNPELAGKTALQILDVLIEKAGARGLRIILDRHRPGSDGQSALWYTAQYSEQRWISDWVMLAQKYKGNATVVAFDLHNEPHGAATWGDGNAATDWRAAATRAANAILAAHSDALFIIEGIEVYANNNYWWGGNLRGASAAPVQLSSPEHVIYSPHDYPASLFAQPWFSDPSYPANLPNVFDQNWGNLASTAPVLVGEFGTKLETDSDRKWLAALTQYIGQHGMSFTYWSFNPNSGDTGGIVGDDWTTVRQDKMAYLTPIIAPLLPVN
jgi:endoglucanase